MAKEKTITTQGVIALKHFRQALDTAELHLQKGKKEMIKSFPNAKIEDVDISSKKARINGERVGYVINQIFEEEGLHSEILIALHIHEVKYQVQMWLAPEHSKANEILEKARKSNIFNVAEKDEFGYMFNLNTKLYSFIESDDDELIAKWFESSLEKIKQFIAENEDIAWHDKVKD